MKKYLKPDVEIMDVEIDSLLQASITEIQGLDGVTTGGEFPSGETTDSRLLFLFNED